LWSSKLLKLIALVVVLCFTTTTVGWSTPPVSVPITKPIQKLNISIPEEFGSIRESFQGEGSKIIVHIQDAHANYEAQSNIRNLLDYLSRQHQFNFVALEGASEALYPASYHFYPFADINIKIADYLAQKGELSGAEMYALELHEGLKEGNVQFQGVEGKEIFDEDLKLFREVLRQRESIIEYFKNLKARLDMVKSRVYQPQLLKYDRVVRSYEKKEIDLIQFLVFLEKEAKKVLDLEITHPLNQRVYPYLCRMLRVKAREDEMEMERVEADIAGLKQVIESKVTDRLEKKLVLRGLEVFTEKRRAKEQLSLMSRLYSRTQLSPRQYFEFLYGLHQKYGFSVQEYQNLRIFSEHLILQSEVTGPEFFKEMERLVNGIYDRLAKTEEEKEILTFSRNMHLSEKLMLLEAMSEDYEKINTDQERYSPQVLESRLSVMTRNVGAVREQPLRIKTTFMASLKFYSLAEKRNSALLNNTLQKMSRADQEKGVLIAGGFHTEGLTKLLKQRNISHLVIQPRIQTEFGRENYYASALDNWKTVFERAKIKMRIMMIKDLEGIPEPEIRRHIDEMLDGVIHSLEDVLAREISVNPRLADNPDALMEKIRDYLLQNPHLKESGLEIQVVPGIGEMPGQFGIVFIVNGRAFEIPVSQAVRVERGGGVAATGLRAVEQPAATRRATTSSKDFTTFLFGMIGVCLELNCREPIVLIFTSDLSRRQPPGGNPVQNALRVP